MNLYELRFNLTKNGLISSLFCSKLAKFKIESYLNEFLLKFNTRSNDVSLNSTELRTILDILFYFYRKHNRIGVQIPCGTTTTTTNPINTASSGGGGSSSYYDIDDDTTSLTTLSPIDDHLQQHVIDDREDEEDEGDNLLKLDLISWIKSLAGLLINNSESYRIANSTAAAATAFSSASSLHFDNVYFILQHLLRAPDCGAHFAHLLQFPIMLKETLPTRSNLNLNNSSNSNINMTQLFQLQLHSSKSDPLVNLYFDGYLKLIAAFSGEIKQRDAFLFLNKARIEGFRRRMNKQADKCWQFIDLEGIVIKIKMMKLI